MPLSTVPALNCPGQRTNAGTRQPAFPIRVFLGPEWSYPGIRPTVVIGPVIRRVHDDGIVSNAQIIEFRQHLPDVLIMGDHDVIVEPLPALAACFSAQWVLKCIAVVLYQTKKGFPSL